MAELRYPAARLHAQRLRDHFARQVRDPRDGRKRAVGLPDPRTIAALVDAGFWASLQREEGYSPEISLALLPPARAEHPMRLAAPLALRARALARLGPAVERPGIHLGVWRDGGKLVVWGTTRSVPSSCFVLEVLGPGLLVVKHRIRDSPKFRNVAVFEGERVKLIRRVRGAPDSPALLRSLLGHGTSRTTDGGDDLLLRLAVSMRAHKRGGTLLVVPAESEKWRESILRPANYLVEPPFAELAELLAASLEERAPAMEKVVDAVAGLTAVDGATVINDRYELLAFGVKIGRPDGRPRVERVTLSEPVEGNRPAVVGPLQLGGTRHNSAAQFAQDQRDAIAMVASQDGRFTLFAWSAREGMVHAHRVEALLL
jgi:sensor domain DACNV-containing protein